MSNMIAFDIPESPDEIAKWLESIICEGDLRSLVAQLISVHGVADQRIEIDAFLAEDRQAMLAQGLCALPASKIQSLLMTPVLLLDLQQKIMAEGGDYWRDKFQSAVGQETIQRTNKVIAEILEKQHVVVGKAERPGSRWSVSSLLALAAGILIAISGTWYWNSERNNRQPVQVAAGWGWASESGIPAGGSAKEYLTALSNGADAWFNSRPSDNNELATRLTEFSAGCELLINADHAPLPDEDKAWLRYKCRVWKRQIDEQLAAVGQSKLVDVLRVSDEIARDISKSLRERESQA